MPAIEKVAKQEGPQQVVNHEALNFENRQARS